MKRRRAQKTRTDILLSCPCGAKAAVFQNGESRWFAHCVSCGMIVFWSSPQLTERAKAGAWPCTHGPEPKICKDGRSETSWCPSCRLRLFAPIRAGR